MISPTVAPSCGTSRPCSSTTRSSPDVMQLDALPRLDDRASAGVSSSCSGRGSQMVMNGAVSVRP